MAALQLVAILVLDLSPQQLRADDTADVVPGGGTARWLFALTAIGMPVTIQP